MKLCLIRNEISDLNAEMLLGEYTLEELKRATDILIIDDDPFTYLEVLKANDFRIRQKSDIDSIGDVEKYDIILCDVKGVGKFLSSKFEGAYLVQQIKETYPNKIVVIYTGNRYDASYQKYIQYADYTMEKGTPQEDWTELLTDILRKNADPVQQWKETRYRLLKAGVSIIDVAKYEDKYVSAVKNRKYQSLESLCSDSKELGRSILIELLSSTIAKLIKGR